MDTIDPELIIHLERTTGLNKSLCTRLVLEVVASFEETLEAFVRRRHLELKDRDGLRNEEIYKCILEEAQGHRFKAATLSERQVRRIIYG